MVKKKKTPQNRVGHYVPTLAEVQEMREKVASLQAFADMLGPSLSSAERMQVLKPRLGGEKIGDAVFELGSKYGVTSRLLSPEAAAKDRALYESLTKLVADVSVAQQAIQDIYLAARSEYWGATLHFYGALCQMAETDPRIAKELEPIIAFFALDPSDDKKSDTVDETLA